MRISNKIMTKEMVMKFVYCFRTEIQPMLERKRGIGELRASRIEFVDKIARPWLNVPKQKKSYSVWMTIERIYRKHKQEWKKSMKNHHKEVA